MASEIIRPLRAVAVFHDDAHKTETDKMHQHRNVMYGLSVGLGHSLQLVLLLDGVAVGGSLGGINQLISQTLGDGLDVTESSLTGAGAQKPDGLEEEVIFVNTELF